MASLIEHLSDQWAARASCPSSLLWGSVTDLVLHAVPCLAIENCLVLPAVAGALVRDLRQSLWLDRSNHWGFFLAERLLITLPRAALAAIAVFLSHCSFVRRAQKLTQKFP
jgi:hypothetical protein